MGKDRNDYQLGHCLSCLYEFPGFKAQDAKTKI